MVAGGDCLCNYHHPVGPAVHSMGCVALSHRSHLHLLLPVSGIVDRPILPMARSRDLSAEFYLADFDGTRRDYSRLDPDEDAELHSDIINRRRRLGNFGVGLQLYSARPLSPARAVY